MTKEELKKLIDQSEGHNLELKKSTSLRQEIGEAVSAFANTDGGVILIGISPDGEIVGVDIGKKTLEDLANGIKENTDPRIYPQMKIHNVDGKNLIEIIVKEADEKPVFFQGHAYQRVGRTSPRLSVSRIRELTKQERKAFTWDEKICEGANLEDIDDNKVKWFLDKARRERNLDIDINTPAIEALEKLELARNGRLTNAAVLLFSKNTQKFFRQAKLRCARYKGTTPITFIDLKIIEGNLIDQVEEAENFVLSHIKRAAKIVMFKREEVWEYPPNALREAIVNAVCHRDYSNTSDITIGIFDDRIEISDPGNLPEPLTPAMLKKQHKSIPRNPPSGLL